LGIPAFLMFVRFCGQLLVNFGSKTRGDELV